MENGLPNGFINAVLQDKLGYMWFATENALSRYDGYNFKNYRYDPANCKSIGIGRVTDIYEDRCGTLWVTTGGGGLNKFDRETDSFIRYINDPNDPTSIGSNNVECITGSHRNGKDFLWIGTGRGMNRFDPETGVFTRFAFTDRGHTYSFVEGIAVDSSGYIWVGPGNGGLYKFDPLTEAYTHFLNDPSDPHSISSDLMFCLLVDRKGILWVGTFGGGLDKFDSTNDQFISYRHDPYDPTTISNDLITAIFEDETGVLWIGTTKGINTFNRVTGKFTQYTYDPDNPEGLSDNTITCISEDQSGVLWVGAWYGLNKIDLQKSKFLHIKHNPGYKNSLSDNYITSICESHYGGENELWIGTKNGGLNKLNRATGEFTCFRHDPYNANSLSNDFVFAVCEGRSGILWIGNFYGGLNKFDRRTGTFTRYPYDPKKPNGLNCQSVRCLYEDKDGLLWIGTQTGGINTFDPRTNTFSQVGEIMEIIQIYADHLDTLWIATRKGLMKLNKRTGELTRYEHNPEDINSLSSNHLISIYEDKAGNLWIGTDGGGLNKMDRNSGKFIHYTEKDGLSNNLVTGILEDDQKNLWLATHKGISKFNPETGVFRNYDHRDGLLNDQYNYGAFHKGLDGEIFFGGGEGLDAFFPKNIEDNPLLPPVQITDFLIFNQAVPIRKNIDFTDKSAFTIPAHISCLHEITIPYDKNVFSFEFAALDYHSPEKNLYSYKMEGFDPDWVHTDASRRFATYTNLDPGEYIFKVKGSNNDGIWNEAGTSIKIIITPPWWRTRWAYSIYIVIILTIVYGAWRFQTSRLKMKQQMEMKDFETDKLREVDQLKSRFFANISHEFRTPLTLIKGPVRQMLEGEFVGNVKDQYKMIMRNSDRLLKLINQILDLSKLESGQMKLQVAQTDVIKLLKGLVLSFSSLAESKKITLKFKTAEKFLDGYIDRNKIEKIITNLLSNAFKFTPEGGEIIVDCRLKIEDLPSFTSQLNRGNGSISPLEKGDKGGCEENNSQFQIHPSVSPLAKGGLRGVQISVSNTGPGIPADQLDKLFDRFYQADTTYKQDGEGSGIGLALTRELVELHRGTIDVDCRKSENHPPHYSPPEAGRLLKRGGGILHYFYGIPSH